MSSDTWYLERISFLASPLVMSFCLMGYLWLSSGFHFWPKEKSDINEYDTFGEYRPCKLEIMRVPDAGLRIITTSPLHTGDVVQRHTEALDKIFRPSQANKKLGLAKEHGARNTYLLLACKSFDDASLVEGYVHTIDRQSIANIDYIYLVDIGNQERVVRV